jgi:hypothetical protein
MICIYKYPSELPQHVRQSRERDAKHRIMVRRILRKYGYPPDKQEAATLTVLERAELLCGDMAI